MQTFKVPIADSNLPYQAREIKKAADEKLRLFCTQQILDKKLSTKTFNYSFDMSGDRSGGQRKSIQKLKDILVKAVKKQIPYMEYISGGDIVNNHTSANAVTINLKSMWVPVTFEAHTSDNETSMSVHWVKSVRRYFKFLNYKAMRNGIPLWISRDRFTHEIHPDDSAAYDTWVNTGRGVQPNCTIRFRYSATAKLSISAYLNQAYTLSLEDMPRIRTYDQYEQHLIENGLLASLSHFRNIDNWNAYDITSRRTQSRYRGFEKYGTPEKIFLVLDDLQQVIKTLSRKTRYDTAAFNIGSSDAS